MSDCYELIHTGPVQRAEYDIDVEVVSTSKSGSWLFVSEEAEEKLDQVHKPFGRSGDAWLFAVGQGIKTSAMMPFALVCFSQEYRITGHILEVKQGSRSLGISTYSKLVLTPGEIPSGIGCLHVFRKEALKKFSNASAVLTRAWQILSEKPDSKSWLVILDPFQGEWIDSIESEDKKLLGTVLAGRGAPTPVSDKDFD